MFFTWQFFFIVVFAELCEDLTYNQEPWHDSGGPDFTCKTWYSILERCLIDGDDYAFGGMTAKQACCTCGGGSIPAPLPPCERDDNWVHPMFGDVCTDYEMGGQSAGYVCADKEAKRKCCLCNVVEPPPGYVCVDKRTRSGKPWHDSDNYTCEFYERNNCVFSDLFMFGGRTANDACCACGGGITWQCADMMLRDGAAWRDSRGFSCKHYAENQWCELEEQSFDGEIDARTACCVCGGGVSGSNPRPDLGDDVDMEWLLGVGFQNKKHLAGDMILYWNLDSNGSLVSTSASLDPNVPQGHITIGLLGPAEFTGWISVAFSSAGMMNGADGVVGFVDLRPGSENQTYVREVHMEERNPSGIQSSTRQHVFPNASAGVTSDRVGLVFTRPFFSPEAVPIFPLFGVTTVLYAYGDISDECSTPAVPLMCTHNMTSRWTVDIAFNAPTRFDLHELNRGQIGHPCQGTGKLKCMDGLYCVHPDAIDGDIFAPNYETYGHCADATPKVLPSIVQRLFPPDENGKAAGYQNNLKLPGGLELLWTINRFSAPSDPWGLGDTISLALISTVYQGWIAIGWSPTGKMKNTSVVFGWRDADENEYLDDAYLLGTDVMYQTMETADRQKLRSREVIRQGDQMAIYFERPLFPENEVPIVEGVNHVIVAAGPFPQPDDASFIPFHEYWASHDIAFIRHSPPLMAKGDFCGGLSNLSCAANLTCVWLNVSWFNLTYPLVYLDLNGFVVQANYTAKASRVYSNHSEILGRSVCMESSLAASVNAARVNLTQISDRQVLNRSAWNHTIELDWGFTLCYSYLNDTIIELALKSSLGPGWVGLGFGSQMVGTVAVVGWLNQTVPNIREYHLPSKFPWQIFPLYLEEEDPPVVREQISLDPPIFMNASNMTVLYQAGEIAIRFQMMVGPIIRPGTPQSIIYAGGRSPTRSDDYFGYHSFRDTKEITFAHYVPPPTPPSD